MIELVEQKDAVLFGRFRSLMSSAALTAPTTLPELDRAAEPPAPDPNGTVNRRSKRSSSSSFEDRFAQPRPCRSGKLIEAASSTPSLKTR